MQLTRKTHPWKYLLLAVAAALVLAAAVVPRPKLTPSYRRYVSPALPDGVRYTFLYPATLDDILSRSMPAHNKGKILQLVIVSKKGSGVPGAPWWQNRFKPDAEFVGVTVEKATIKPLRSSRSEKRRADRAEIEHTILMDDPRAHEHFRYWHAEDFGRTDAFTQHDRVVTNSFRVLLPGELVPRP